MSPRLRFWKKVFETPVEIVVCFVAGALGTISIPLVILWNLTVERKFILASIQDEIEREERLNKRPESDPPPSPPREYFERWAHDCEGYVLGGVARHEGDENFIYNDDDTQIAWGGFLTGREYEELLRIQFVGRYR
jgi:heme exporter protein D